MSAKGSAKRNWTEHSVCARLVLATLGKERGRAVLSALDIAPELMREHADPSRAEIAMALNAVLFSDLLERVPTAAAYVDEVVADGRQVCFDHGALRTVDGSMGALPRGQAAFARILEPLGYRVADTYPLPRLRMTGYAFAHLDFPETVPQFFVSELHVDALPEDAQAAAARVFGKSMDPLHEVERRALDAIARDGRCAFDLAYAALPGLAHAFARHHEAPRLSDYETLRRHSAEAAWIATEGNAFNHATDRVPDVGALAGRLTDEGWPMKSDVEISANGRVRQTAFIADKVMRSFLRNDGGMVEREVPGSFYEFIARDIDPETGRLDLTFDSGNATGIFAVTSPS